MEEKTCENCKYFLRHYVKSDTQYLPVFYGHCINGNLPDTRMRERYSRNIRNVCNLWESVEIKKAERVKRIKDTLRHMAGRIEEMVMILKEDEE